MVDRELNSYETKGNLLLFSCYQDYPRYILTFKGQYALITMVINCVLLVLALQAY